MSTTSMKQQDPLYLNEELNPTTEYQYNASNFLLYISGGSGTGNLVFSVESITGKASITSSGVLTFEEPGSIWVKIYKESDEEYMQSKTLIIEITLTQRHIWVRVDFNSDPEVYTPNLDWNIGDSLPQLSTLQQDYHVTGLVGGDTLPYNPELTSQYLTPRKVDIYFVYHSQDYYPYKYRKSYSTELMPTDVEASYPVSARKALVPLKDGSPNIGYDPKINYRSGTLTIVNNRYYRVTASRSTLGWVRPKLSEAKPYTEVEFEVHPYTGVDFDEDTGVVVEATVDSSTVSLPVTRISITEQEEKKIWTYKFTMTFGPANIVPTFTNAYADKPNPYVDVSTSDEFYDYILYCYYARSVVEGQDVPGILIGTYEGSSLYFHPLNFTTREQAIVAIWRISHCPNTPDWMPFVDMYANQYADFRKAISWGSFTSILNGRNEYYYDPRYPSIMPINSSMDTIPDNGYITRQELASMLYRYSTIRQFNVHNSGGLILCADIDIADSWARIPINWCIHNELMDTYSQGRFFPGARVYRREFAQILTRYCMLYAW